MSRQVDGDPLRALLAVAEDADEWQLLRVATEAAVALLGDHGCCVLTGEPRIAFSTKSPSQDARPIELSRYPEVATALDRGVPLAFADVKSEPLFDPVRANRALEMRSLVVVPLIAGSAKLGVLIVESAPERPVAVNALETAELVGQLTARLLEHARLRAPRRAKPRQRVLTPISRPQRLVPLPNRARRLLIVDDDVALANLSASILRVEGYQTRVATNGADCLGYARAEPPDLILLDVMLPGSDGFTVAQRLSEDPLTAGAAVLFLSGTPDLTARFRGLKLASSDFLAKPFSQEDLIARVALSLQQLDARKQLLSEANVDDLTGLGNARHLQVQLGVEQARSKRYGTSLALLMIDVDRLKRINDEHGHLAGSETIAMVGDILTDGIRETDVAVRYGGDEFVVLLPHSTQLDAMEFAERTLARVRAARPMGLSFSVSIGVAARVMGSDLLLNRLFEEADLATYRAKDLGGDCACAFDPALRADTLDAKRTGTP
jgi:two-component system, cell cycle response regulator